MRLLLIEDETQIAKPLIKLLKERSYAVDYAEDGEEGYTLAYENGYDCILLDLNLPKMDGIEIAKKLRTEKVFTPILMLTARNQQQQIWEGFENGTDDYLTKPFDLKELLLRINALIKRNSKNKAEVLTAEKLVLDSSSMEVKLGNALVNLDRKEFGILQYLLRNKNKVVSTEELMEHVWDGDLDAFSNTVRTHIKTLRKKIDPEKTLIVTIRGKGYVIRK